jgi:hypothetical protein
VSSKTNYYENLLLNAIFRNDASARAVFSAIDAKLALFTSTLTETSEDASSETEVSATGYARVDCSTTNFGTASTTGSISNTAVITFGPYSTLPGTIRSVGLVDQTTGKILAFYVLGSPVTPAVSTSTQIAIAGAAATEQ